MNKKHKTLPVLLLSGVLPCLTLLALITPLWLYLAGRDLFLLTLLNFAGGHFTVVPEMPISSHQLAAVLLTLYVPALLLTFSLWQGIKVTQILRTHNVLNQQLASCIKNIALTLLVLGGVLPACRFIIPLMVYWPQEHYQITIEISDICLLLIGSLLYVTFQSMQQGIKAEEENKEFI